MTRAHVFVYALTLACIPVVAALLANAGAFSGWSWMARQAGHALVVLGYFLIGSAG